MTKIIKIPLFPYYGQIAVDLAMRTTNLLDSNQGAHKDYHFLKGRKHLGLAPSPPWYCQCASASGFPKTPPSHSLNLYYREACRELDPSLFANKRQCHNSYSRLRRHCTPLQLLNFARRWGAFALTLSPTAPRKCHAAGTKVRLQLSLIHI